ncbi:hypothetical protein ASD53_02370 [Lysobacter sp. Root559]|nr:hypothetical protein ASD53_02370 [Lysobacter sp. Root559]
MQVETEVVGKHLAPLKCRAIIDQANLFLILQLQGCATEKQQLLGKLISMQIEGNFLVCRQWKDLRNKEVKQF